jgi:hypothetical protein
VIHGAVLHFLGEQPLYCDLRALPAAGETTIVVTNMRFVDGRRPGFIDHPDSWFVYPLSHVRFIEIPADAFTADGSQPTGLLARTGRPDEDAEDDDGAADAKADELLRRMRAT